AVDVCLQIAEILSGESGFLQHTGAVLRAGQSVELSDEIPQRLARRVWLLLPRLSFLVYLGGNQFTQVLQPIPVRRRRIVRAPLAPGRVPRCERPFLAASREREG